jgi:hypothetical protein
LRLLLSWTVLFFPIAAVHFISNSVVIEKEIDADKFMEWYRSRRKKK